MGPEKCRHHFPRQERRADVHPSVLVHLAAEELAAICSFFPNDFRALDQRWVIDEKRPTLARYDVFRFVETQCREVPDAAQRPALVARIDRLGRIFNNKKLVSLRDTHNCIHLARHAGVMYNCHCLCTRRDRVLYLCFVDIHRIRSNIDEDRRCTTQNKCIGGRHKCIGRHDDFIARFQVQQHGSHFQCASAGVSKQRPARTQCLFEPVVAAPAVFTVAGEMTLEVRIGNVVELVVGHIGLIERDHQRLHSMMQWVYGIQAVCRTLMMRSENTSLASNS